MDTEKRRLIRGEGIRRREWGEKNQSDLRWLPDTRAGGGRTHHRVALLGAPGSLELRHVAERTIHPPLGRCMFIGVHEPPHELGAIDLAPHLRPAEEEPLLRGEA